MPGLAFYLKIAADVLSVDQIVAVAGLIVDLAVAAGSVVDLGAAGVAAVVDHWFELDLVFDQRMTKDLMLGFGYSHIVVAAEDSHSHSPELAGSGCAALAALVLLADLAVIVDADLDLDVRKHFHSGPLLHFVANFHRLCSCFVHCSRPG